MERRLILAVALSFLILLSWSALTSKRYHIDNKAVIEKTPPVTLPPAPPNPLNVADELQLSPESFIKFSTGKREITFNEPQAAIQSVEFKDYQSYKFPLKYGLLLKGENLRFKKENAADNSLVFTYRDKDKQINKRFIFSNSNYSIELEIEIQNLSPLPLNFDLPLVLGALDFSRDQAQGHFQDVTVNLKEKALHLNARKDMTFQEVEFIGLRDRYFCAIIAPAIADNYTAWIRKIDAKESEIGLMQKQFVLGPGQKRKETFRIYLGPQELRLISAVQSNWSVVMHYGFFNFISHILLQSLEFLYRLVHNWGWAIVILSIIVYVLFYPLSLKQMHSMKQMQALQPAIEELRKTHKDNPQKLNKEIMELYRKHRVNPFSGCLPLLLQMPVFFALYQALMRSIALKGAHFLWIKDLSEPDRLLILGKGLEINILPILMSIGMFIQQKFSMVPTGGSSSEQQKLMVIIFPIMFGLIFYRMPSGLVLYWFINSFLMLVYQLQLKRAR